MRRREQQRLTRMVTNPPRTAPNWLTSDMVVQATSLDNLDFLQRTEMRRRRILLLCAILRTEANHLRALVTRPTGSEPPQP